MTGNKLYKQYWEWASKYHKYRRQRQLQYCRQEPPLFEIKWIDPEEVAEFTRRPVPFWRRKWQDHGQVKDGDWDIRDDHVFKHGYDKDWYRTQRPTVRYADAIFHQSMIERYVKERSWEETKQFEISKQRIASGESTWHGCESSSDLREKGNMIDELFNNIATQGYQSQPELRRKFKNAIKNEITVDIGRNGSYLFVDGRHRLSIVKILGLNRIPVQVCTVHRNHR